MADVSAPVPLADGDWEEEEVRRPNESSGVSSLASLALNTHLWWSARGGTAGDRRRRLSGMMLSDDEVGPDEE